MTEQLTQADAKIAELEAKLEQQNSTAAKITAEFESQRQSLEGMTQRHAELARRMEQRIQILQARIPKMGFDLEQNECYEIAFTLMGLLPERVWAEIAPMPEGVFADDGEAGQETQSADADQSLTAL